MVSEVCICSDCCQMISQMPSGFLSVMHCYPSKWSLKGRFGKHLWYYRVLHLRDLSFISVHGSLVRALLLCLGGSGQAFPLLLLYISSRTYTGCPHFGPKPNWHSADMHCCGCISCIHLGLFFLIKTCEVLVQFFSIISSSGTLWFTGPHQRFL